MRNVALFKFVFSTISRKTSDIF